MDLMGLFRVVLDIAFWGLWILLVGYCVWFLVLAKTHQTVSLGDLAMRWKIHKSSSGCASSGIQALIKKKSAVIGFRCGCGFEFRQQRLVSQSILKVHPLSEEDETVFCKIDEFLKV